MNQTKKRSSKVKKQKWYSKFGKKELVFVLFFALIGAAVLLKANAAIATTCSGPVVNLTGTTTSPYTNPAPAAGTTFNLTNWKSNYVTVPGTGRAFEVGASTAPNGICITKGVVNGRIDPTQNWTYVHDTVNGFGYRTTSSGLNVVDRARLHNLEDGWEPRECTDVNAAEVCNNFVNGGAKFLMKDTYMTAIRDNGVENDDFIPGEIRDSLFDGIWTFLSEQQIDTPGSGVGAGEDPNLRITRTYVRLSMTNGGETGGGRWFKWSATAYHKLIITDSVLAVENKPKLGWAALNIPAGTQWKGANYILWLGAVGQYKGPKPAGVTFLEGQAAKNKWNQVRNPWLTKHGYTARPVNDFNSMDDPVVAPKL